MRCVCTPNFLSRIICLITAALLLAYSAAAQTPSRIPQNFSLQVNGIVRYARSHQPAEHVLVRIESFSGGLIGEVETDRSGKFSFTGLQANQYVVTIHAPGFIDQRRDVNLLTANTDYINVDLAAENTYRIDPVETGAGSVVSVTAIPPDAEAEYSIASDLLNEQTADHSVEARTHLQKALKIFPQYLEAQIMLGLTYMNQKDWANAEKALQAAIAINNQASTAYFALGDTYLRQKKYAAAQETLQTGLKLKEDSAAAHLMIARAFWESAPSATDEKGFRASAETAWREVKRALQIDPKLPEAHLFAGNLLLRAHRTADALTHYEQYLALAPNGEFASQTRETIAKIRASIK